MQPLANCGYTPVSRGLANSGYLCKDTRASVREKEHPESTRRDADFCWTFSPCTALARVHGVGEKASVRLPEDSRVETGREMSQDLGCMT